MTLSVIVLTHNDEDKIKKCLESVKWADEIVVVDSSSTGKTIEISKKYTSKIFRKKFTSFADQRNFALGKTKGEWVLYVDSDERIGRELRKEIEDMICGRDGDRERRTELEKNKNTAYRMPRKNYFYGKRVKHGGYWPDYVTRLFKKDFFKNWQGKIHESPKYKGRLGTFKNPLIHLAHRNISEGLIKSSRWTKMEAELFYKSGHPKVTIFHLIKVIVWEFCFRYFKKQGFKDGFVGFVEAFIQALNRFFVYVQIWEMQQRPSIEEKYKKMDFTF